ncbi:MAG: riboflavin kinase [Candidatus Gracilibacteria bacterium]
MYTLIKGKVIEGKKLGRTLGFRTANVEIADNIIAEGTYKINGLVNGEIYRGVGVYLKNSPVFEAHFFDFDADIYGQEIEIIALYKIRENKRFESLDALKDQIQQDVEMVQKTEDYVLTFGTFDILHPGHEYYLKNAKMHGDKIVMILATDANVLRFKNRLPRNNQEMRLQNIQQSFQFLDTVLIGEGNNPFQWLEIYKPKVICLGYDQMGFSDKLDTYIEKENLDTKVVRIQPFCEDIYKSSKM